MTAAARPNPLRDVRPSARTKLAVMLYVTGACKTKREASTAAGFHPQYLTMLTSPSGGSQKVHELMEEMTSELLQKGVDMSVVMNKLGKLGIAKIAQLAVTGGNERIQLDAAKTLADRSPETAGIQKVQLEAGMSLGKEDAQMLAKALVESAQLANEFARIGTEGLIELDLTEGASSESHAAEGIAVSEADQQASAPAIGPAPEETVRLPRLRLEK